MPSEEDVVILPVLTEADWAEARAIRETVFIGEQQCPPEEEWDAWDEPGARGTAAHHLLARVGGTPAGTARWHALRAGGLTDEGLEASAVKLERFAVLQPFRSRGLGRALVARALADARAEGYGRFVLHAQSHLQAFYAGFGFAPEGEPFWEAGIEHVKMALTDPKHA